MLFRYCILYVLQCTLPLLSNVRYCTNNLHWLLPFAYCTMHTACCTLHNVVHIVPPKTSSAQLCERKRRRYRRVLGSQSIGTRPNDYDEDLQDHGSDKKRFWNGDVRQNLSMSYLNCQIPPKIILNLFDINLVAARHLLTLVSDLL